MITTSYRSQLIRFVISFAYYKVARDLIYTKIQTRSPVLGFYSKH